MVTTVGRLRANAALQNGIMFLLVSHNTKMATARGAILTAEALAMRGYLG